MIKLINVKALVLGDEHTVYAFKLLGFEGQVVRSGKEALKIIESLAQEESNVALVIVTSDLVDEVRDEFNRLRLKLKKPTIFELPSLKEVKFKEVNYLAILRSVLGV